MLEREPGDDTALGEEVKEYDRQLLATDPTRRTLKWLEQTAAWFATARHRQVIDEAAIGALAQACLADVQNDTSKRARGAVWARAQRKQPTDEPDYWLAELRNAEIGGETSEAEANGVDRHSGLALASACLRPERIVAVGC